MTVRKSCEIPNWEVATLLKLSSQNIDKEMNNKFKKQILQQAVKMDGSINFQTNGDINIYPCPWEQDKQVTDGSRVNYTGGISVDADGRTRVKRYNVGSQGPMYETLYETAHGAVKMTRPQYSQGRRRLDKEAIIISFRFPKKYGLALTKALYAEESDEIMSYLKTRKEETVWK